MKKAVIYARYSSDKQNDQSIEGQIRECVNFAKRNDINIIHTYTDKALSGKTDLRPAFQQMIKDSEKKSWDFVIVYRLDRFARNRYDSAIYKAKLRKNNVKLLSAMENITDAPEGILMESLLEGMAEYYSAELSLKIKRGMTENILKGYVVGGKTPLGYKVENKKYVIDEKTAPIICKIFEMYAKGMSISSIIDDLNEKRCKTVAGTSFSKNSLEKILRNKKYIGIYEHSGQIVEGGTPIIVEKTLFEKVQIVLSQNKKAPARSKGQNHFLLTTKLFCDCGSSMAGTSGNSHNKTKHSYYQCSKKCGRKLIPRDALENLVFDVALSVVSSVETIDHIANTIVKLSEQQNKDDSNLLKLQKDIGYTKKYIKNITKILKSGVESTTLAEELITLEKDLKVYEKELSLLEATKPKLTKEMIVFWLSKFVTTDKTDFNSKRNLIDTFIKFVKFKKEKVIITFNYSENDLLEPNTVRVPHEVVRIRTLWWR